MATKDVLEALAAGAGRQSAIGGLMFQDAQKREGRDYAAALEKEKYRRTGEATALKNARGGYKFAADKAFSAMESWKKAYIRAMKGQTGSEFEDGDFLSTGGTYTDDQIAEIKTNYLKSVEEYNYSRRKFFEYSGIGEEFKEVVPEDLDKIAGGTGTAKSRSNLEQDAQNVVTALTKDSVGTLNTIARQIEEDGGGESLTTLIDTINHQRETAHMNKREAANLERRPDDQAELDKTHLSKKEEVKTRKLLAKLITNEVAMTRTEEYKRPIPRVFDPTGQSFSQLDQNVRRDKVIASGFGDEIESQAGYNQAIASEAQRTAPKGTTPDPLTEMAEQVAADRAQQAAQAQDAPPRQGRGMISQGQYQKAYADAQQMLTQMFQQFGNVTLQQFQQIIAEQGLKGIELMAYRQAYKDLVGKKPTGLGFESGGLQERIDAGGSISSLSNVLFP